MCDPPNNTLLCFGDGTTPLIGLDGSQVTNFLPASATLGQLDRTHTSTNSYGGSLQATSTAQIAGHDNHVVVGSSVDHGRVNFTANSELGTVEPNLFITGTGVIINQPTGDVAPVSLKATTTYTGVYATNTFDITPQVSVTGGGRFNVAQIKLEDQLGTDLNGDSRYSRFNPVIGMTYRFVPNVTVYAGYSETNRAPTPLELGCADPARPCLLDNFLVSDPPLKQVVSHTYEAGLRGLQEFGPKRPAEMERRRLPHRQRRRHHQRCEPGRAGLWLLPERGNNAPAGRRGERRLHARAVAPLREPCICRRYVPHAAHIAVAEQSNG